MPRTNTKGRKTFERPFPSAVTYDLSVPNRTTITLPPNSTWSSGPHWHETHTEFLQVVSGRAEVTLAGELLAAVGPEAGTITVPRGAVHEWARSRTAGLDEDLVVREWTDPRDGEKELFFRNLNSVILDAQAAGPGSWALRTLDLELMNIFRRLDNWPLLVPPRWPGWAQTATTKAVLAGAWLLGRVLGCGDAGVMTLSMLDRAQWLLSKEATVHLQHSQSFHDATLSTASSFERCSRIWDRENARLDACALRYIYLFPAFASVVLLLVSLLKIYLPLKSPIWARNIVQEEVPKSGNQDVILPSANLRILGSEIAFSGLCFVGLMSTIPAILSHVARTSTIPHAVAWGVLIVYIIACRPKTASTVLSVVSCLLLACDLTVLLNGDVLSSLEKVTWVLSAASAGLVIVFNLLMPLRHPNSPADAVSNPFTPPTSELRSPEDNLTLWQWMSVSWMGPMVREGKTRKLEFEDVWSLAYEFEHARLHEAFRILKGSVFKRLMLANGLDLFITSSLGLVEMLGKFAGPVLLQQLLKAMEDPHSPKRAAIVFAVLSLAARLIVAQTGVFKLWYCRRVYERSRGELITMLYEKTLRRKIIGESISIGEEKDQNSASSGKVLNIMRGDAYEIAQRFWDWPDLIVKPTGLIVSIILVWQLIGWPSFLGIAAFVVVQCTDILLVRLSVRYEKKRRAATDDKLKVLTQFIESIRHLRYNSWESKWLEGIMTRRQKELNLLLKMSFISVLLVFTGNLASGVFPVFAFLGLTLIAGQKLRIDIAFPALQLFLMLEDNLAEIPDLITRLINAWVAMGRIESFMREPDREGAGDDEGLVSKPEVIKIEDTTFAWPGLETAVLKNVSLSIEPGVTVVHGKVGAGKSALLRALLGELDILSGQYSPPNAMVAYCDQTPWLQNMSIRDNILFGYPMDKERYKQVLAACALTPDLTTFTNGDLSFIGENGIGLSGGQKARVALARAVYSPAPFLFLDDPISALDQQTAEHIVKRCINGLLCKDRGIIIVTHRLDLVRGLANQVIEVTEGHAKLQQGDLIQFDDLSPLEADGESAEPTNGKEDGGDKNYDQGDDVVKDKFIEEEHRAEGTVKLQVYWEYIKSGKLWLWALLTVVTVISRVFLIAEVWFLKAWGESYDRASASLTIDDPFKRLPAPDVDIRPWLIGFALFAFISAFSLSSVRSIMSLTTYFAGKSIFQRAVTRVSNAGFRYYDVTPVGRLMNRMTSDFGSIDGAIGFLFYHMAHMVIKWVSSIVVIASITPTFFVFALIITSTFVYVYTWFLPTSQSLRRLEMVSLTPLMANFGTLIQGLVTVRAFRAQRRFQAGVIRVVDTFQKMDHFYWSLQAWLQIRFDVLSATSTLVLTLLAIYTNVSPGLTAFVLTAASGFVSTTHGLCRIYGQLELDFTSVERVLELLHIEQEPKGERSAPAAWPTSGEIVFDNVNIRYAPHLDLVLQDVNLTIPGGSNVAITGRTGSGKSTLALSLLATVRPDSGKILLDGLDICSLDPATLRRRITFLAQEPTLFVGTMRLNLDPLDEFSDAECADVLSRLGGDKYGWSLETHVEGGGKNLSQGQRQLVQLARAILRRSPLVVLDEATASIDLGTSLEVQDILRQEMGKSTVITIAHRVEAVSNADWCIELAKGRVVAQGPSGRAERAAAASTSASNENSDGD